MSDLIPPERTPLEPTPEGATALPPAETSAEAGIEAKPQPTEREALTEALSHIAALRSQATTDREAIAEVVRSLAKIRRSLDARSKQVDAIAEGAQSQSKVVSDLAGQLSQSIEIAQAKAKDALAVASEAIAAKTQIADSQKVIATKSDHIQGAQDHADKVRADLDRQLTAATKQATDAEAITARAQTAATQTNTALEEAKSAKSKADTELLAVQTARKNAEDASAKTKGLAVRSAKIEEDLAAYEKRIAALELQCADQLKRIEALLPGATSAGLAHSFGERQKAFQIPGKGWQRIFFWSLVALVLVAASGLWQVYHMTEAPSYDEVLRLWLSRLPIAGALVWLAMHASRESALAKRLEEDYGYKAAIASSFEGFQTQMAKIDVDVGSKTPLAKLCADTLTTIATPPGRIYEKHRLVLTPSSEIARAAKGVAEAATAVRSGI